MFFKSSKLENQSEKKNNKKIKKHSRQTLIPNQNPSNQELQAIIHSL